MRVSFCLLNLSPETNQEVCVPLDLDTAMTLLICICAMSASQPFPVLFQFDGEGPASEERVQEEHRQPVPIRLHAAEPPPYVSDTHVHRQARAGGRRHVHTLSTRQTPQTASRKFTDSHTPHHPHLQHPNAGSRSHAGGHGCTAAESHRYTNLSQNLRELGEDGCSQRLQILATIMHPCRSNATAALTKLMLACVMPPGFSSGGCFGSGRLDMRVKCGESWGRHGPNALIKTPADLWVRKICSDTGLTQTHWLTFPLQRCL